MSDNDHTTVRMKSSDLRRINDENVFDESLNDTIVRLMDFYEEHHEESDN